MADHRKLRILVIDDEVTQRMLVKDYLEEAGHVVRQADDGKRGLKMATTTGPDVILLDVMLPSIDGFDLCRSLKEHPDTAHTPVILITASREGDVIARGLAAGADDFVTKPVDWNFLADRVEHVARKAKERSQLLNMIEARGTDAPEAVSPGGDVHAPVMPSLEELMRSADLQGAHAVSDFSAEIEKLKAEYEAELDRSRAENERLVRVARNAVQQAQTQAERAHAAEIDKLRKLLENAHAAAAERDAEHRATMAKRAGELRQMRELYDADRLRFDSEMEAMRAELAARPAQGPAGVPWSIALKALAYQAGLASSLTARTQAALASPGRLDASRLADLDRGAQALSAAIANLKRFAHAQATAGECKETTVNLAVMASQITAQAKGIATNARVDLRTRISGPTEAILADDARLRYAWICLVVNAIRHTPPGGQVVIEVSTAENGDVEVGVSDTGAGLTAPKVDEFNAILDVETKQAPKAGEPAGLGIPMAATLARQMGGRLVFESQPGAGTEAAIVFSAQKAVRQSPSLALVG